MYGKALKCDICERVEIIRDFDLNTTFFDVGFGGWIRMTVNKPRDYGWTFRDPKYATTVDSVDCCSIDCARRFLRDVGDTVTDEVPAEATA